jgi:hypothetical protein
MSNKIIGLYLGWFILMIVCILFSRQNDILYKRVWKLEEENFVLKNQEFINLISSKLDKALAYKE